MLFCKYLRSNCSQKFLKWHLFNQMLCQSLFIFSPFTLIKRIFPADLMISNSKLILHDCSWWLIPWKEFFDYLFLLEYAWSGRWYWKNVMSSYSTYMRLRHFQNFKTTITNLVGFSSGIKSLSWWNSKSAFYVLWFQLLCYNRWLEVRVVAVACFLKFCWLSSFKNMLFWTAKPVRNLW